MGKVAESIVAEGVTVLPQALPRPVLDAFLAYVKSRYEEQDGATERESWYRDGMLLLSEIPDEEVAPLRAAIDTVLVEHFGDAARSQGASLVRRVTTKRAHEGGPEWSNHTDWHLDSEYFHCDDKFTINFWIPLTDGVNVHKPGITFWPMGQRDAIEMTGYVHDPDNVERDQFGRTTRFTRYIYDLIKADPNKLKRFTPALNIGDVAAFSNWCPHSSYIGGDLNGTRYSIEWRQMFETFSLPV